MGADVGDAVVGAEEGVGAEDGAPVVGATEGVGAEVGAAVDAVSQPVAASPSVSTKFASQVNAEHVAGVVSVQVVQVASATAPHADAI